MHKIALTSPPDNSGFVLPTVYRLVGTTIIDSAKQVEKAKYVVLLADDRGTPYALIDRYIPTHITWRALHHLEGQPFDALFRRFATLPSRRHKDFRVVVDSLSSAPLGDEQRPARAIIYSTKLEDDTLVLTEESVISLVPPLDLHTGIEVTDVERLVGLASSSGSTVVTRYYHHLTYNLNYSWANTELTDVSGQTLCCIPVAALLELPGAHLLLGGDELDKPDGSVLINCPNCRAAYSFYQQLRDCTPLWHWCRRCGDSTLHLGDVIDAAPTLAAQCLACGTKSLLEDSRTIIANGQY